MAPSPLMGGVRDTRAEVGVIKMIKPAIIGASGYTGLELLRLLAGHSRVEVAAVTSRTYVGRRVEEVFPALKGFYEGLEFTDTGGPLSPVSHLTEVDAELFFSCLPHGAGMDIVASLIKAGRKVIDLSADFRIKDAEVYEKWYVPHTASGLLEEAVYGLPELFREDIKKASLIANPGCYPTGAVLALAPVIKEGVVDLSSIIVDSKSGISGAGRGGGVENSFVELSENMKAYKVGTHRHTPEMAQILSGLCGKEVSVTFTPQLVPLSRGIFSTVYVKLKKGASTAGLLELYNDFYKGEPFVRTLVEGTLPELSGVRGSNLCDIGLVADEASGSVTVISAIDNLVKGASGAAVQNMNLVCGFPEDEALRAAPLSI